MPATLPGVGVGLFRENPDCGGATKERKLREAENLAWRSSMKLPVALCATLLIATASALGAGAPVAAQPPGGPAAAPPPGNVDAAQSRAGGRSCFRTRNIRSFRSVDNRTVFVRAGANDIFALELFSPCLGVNWTHNVALRTRGSSQVCEGRANWVNLYVRQTGGRQARCSVSNVRRLTPGDVAGMPRGARP
jgi:hypothetical protein